MSSDDAAAETAFDELDTPGLARWTKGDADQSIVDDETVEDMTTFSLQLPNTAVVMTELFGDCTSQQF